MNTAESGNFFGRFRWLILLLLHLSPLTGIVLGRLYLTFSLVLIVLVPYIKCKKLRSQGLPDSDPALRRWEYLTLPWISTKL